jgi:hypothetical protein
MVPAKGGSTMRNFGIGILTLTTLGVGCDNNLDTLDGHVLGTPESVVFARNDNDHMMVIMSNLPDLCESIASSDVPAKDDFWVLSAWTHVNVDAPGEYAVEAYAAVSENTEIEEFDTESGGIKFKRLGADHLKARIDVNFPGNYRVKANITAEFCDADLFVGMY